jgi:isopenicillin N synthase-like dioxygenase
MLSYHYELEFDTNHENRLHKVPEDVRNHIPKDGNIWDTVGVEDFQPTLLAHWKGCLDVTRHLVSLIALSLGLSEDYIDSVTAYPGGDSSILLYPGHGKDVIEDLDEVGIGAHTDLKILTLLWQDGNKGLQLLNQESEWVFAPPISRTFLVNIGEFLKRLTNDRLKSTVYRVIRHGKDDRYSIPFFGRAHYR